MDKLKHATDEYQFQEELARTYFSNSQIKENHFTNPKPQADNKATKKILFGITAALVLIFSLAFFVVLKSGVMNKNAPAGKIDTARAGSDPDHVYLWKDGEINRDLVANVIFLEGVDKQSKLENGVITLMNEKGAQKAAFRIDFKMPRDFSGNLLYFTAKSKNDAETVRIYVRDDKDGACYAKLDGLAGSWRRFAIDVLDKGAMYVDTAAVTRIGFEIIPDKRDDIGISSVCFRDMYLTKRRE